MYLVGESFAGWPKITCCEGQIGVATVFIGNPAKGRKTTEITVLGFLANKIGLCRNIAGLLKALHSLI
jgi:hypothetical protein